MLKIKKVLCVILTVFILFSFSQVLVFAQECIISPESGKVFQPNSDIKLKITTPDYKENTDNYYLISVYEYVDVKGGRYSHIGRDICTKYNKKGEVINETIRINKYGTYKMFVSFFYTVNGFANYFGGYKVRNLDIDDKWISASDTLTVVIDKLENPVKVKTSTKSLKASSMKKTKKTVKPVSISKAKGTVKVVKIKSGTTSSIYKKISVNSKNGAVTFKKGTYKKGTYKVKLNITAAGNSDYKEKTITKIVKIKVK